MNIDFKISYTNFRIEMKWSEYYGIEKGFYLDRAFGRDNNYRGHSFDHSTNRNGYNRKRKKIVI